MEKHNSGSETPSMRPLHKCPDPNCGSDLVYPVDWAEEGSRHWRIVLRCPECEHVQEDVFPQEQVEEFDDALNQGSRALVNSLNEMVHANMTSEAEFFAKALDADLIDAYYFRPRS